MPVFNDRRIIFLHIGKTGGFSVERALGMPPRDYRKFDKEYVYGLNKGTMTQHARLEYIEKFLSDEQKKYTKLVVIRNPWYRMVSAYYYLFHFHEKKFGSFEKWLEHKYKMVTEKTYREGSHYIPQTEYVYDESGERVVDFIFRTETLDEDFKRFCNFINIPPIELPRTNVSNLRKKPYLEHYNDTTKHMVHEMYRQDIEAFNYQFK